MNNYFNEKNLHSVDGKGRILFPKEVRDHHRIEKGEILHCVPSLTNPAYVEVRTEIQWKRYRESLRAAEEGEKKKDTFRYAELFRETATLDGQGRVLIPQRIREMCGIAGLVAVVDMDDYIEIWARENIEQKYADMVRAFKEMNDRMF